MKTIVIATREIMTATPDGGSISRTVAAALEVEAVGLEDLFPENKDFVFYGDWKLSKHPNRLATAFRPAPPPGASIEALQRVAEAAEIIVSHIDRVTGSEPMDTQDPGAFNAQSSMNVLRLALASAGYLK